MEFIQKLPLRPGVVAILCALLLGCSFSSDTRKADLPAQETDYPASPVDAEINLGNGVKIELVLIRPGSFMMGSEWGNDDEMPVHKVALTKPFYMGKTEFTQAQWKAVMGNNPSHFKGPNHPVEQVSRNDCQALLTKLGEKVGRAGKFRLPTEAEWEYACRAGSTTKYCFGDDEGRLGKYAWPTPHPNRSITHAVGRKKANAWGLYDMHGNVSEWCSDWNGAYPDAAVTDPTGPANGSSAIIRGGNWGIIPWSCRSAHRSRDLPVTRFRLLGFRIVMDYSLAIALIDEPRA